MSRFEESIDVNVPVSVAYDQWTRFEDFPSFMDGVEEVDQLDDKRLHWKASIAGKETEWDAEITDQTPDQRVAWRATDGTENGGAVLFEPLGTARTQVTLRLDAEPRGVVEKAGDALGFLKRQVHDDLMKFKEQVEKRGMTGPGWRGEIHGDEVRPD